MQVLFLSRKILTSGVGAAAIRFSFLIKLFYINRADFLKRKETLSWNLKSARYHREDSGLRCRSRDLRRLPAEDRVKLEEILTVVSQELMPEIPLPSQTADPK